MGPFTNELNTQGNKITLMMIYIPFICNKIAAETFWGPYYAILNIIIDKEMKDFYYPYISVFAFAAFNMMPYYKFFMEINQLN